MSSGGRIGKDAPYTPRGCDMRWFDTAEICEILRPLEQVVFVGDPMLRHVVAALNILIREDLGYGAILGWDGSKNRTDCFCLDQFQDLDCLAQGILSTKDILEHDPLGVACRRITPGWWTDIKFEQITRHPVPKDELRQFSSAISPPIMPANAVPPSLSRRKAFVLGTGLWNNLNSTRSTAWLDTVLQTIDYSSLYKYYKLSDASSLTTQISHVRKNASVLLITPNAAGDQKPNAWVLTQGNEALSRFEHEMAAAAAERNIYHLGTWNMSIQATMYDGAHMDMRGNLVKAMMVLNWLSMLGGGTAARAGQPTILD